MPPQGKQLALPASFLKEIGAQPQSGAGGGKRRQQFSRKEQRKASRVQKKQVHRTPNRQNASHPATAKLRTPPVPVKAKQPSKPMRIVNPEDDDDSIHESDFDMDLDEDDFEEDDEDGMEDGEEEESADELVDDAPQASKSDRKKLGKEDAEIAALEKKLGLKKGKKSKVGDDDDGLDGLLGDLDGSGDEVDEESAVRSKRKAEADEWLAQKRRKANAAAAAASKANRGKPSHSSDEDDFSVDGDGGDGLSDLGNSDYSDDEMEGGSDNDDAFGGFSDDDDDDDDESIAAPRQRENPYVAPTTNVAKYVPPSLRKQGQSMDEVDAQLRRRVQGLINRLTNENMLGILKDFSGLYDNFPRQSVTSALVNLLITLVSSPEPRPGSFFTMIAGFIAAAYKALGVHVSANLVQKIVQVFREHYDQASGNQSDAGTKHLIILLSELYNMQVVGARLIFDYVRLFLVKLSELNTELLLRIIQTCGPSLRREDPRALKEILGLIKPADLKNASVRTSFMMEEMRNLGTNKSKAASLNKDLAEMRTQIRKRIGTLSGSREIQPLNVGLKDIENADKNGQWWVVGASWSGNREKETKAESTDEVVDDTADFIDNDDLGIPDLWQLAKAQGFNTEVRQQIFVALHSATDCQNAELLLRKLRLNKYQRKEMPEVIVRSGEGQAEFNKYYWLVASRFCGDRELAFQFKRCLTQRFKKMGEDVDIDDFDDEDEDYDTRRVVNVGKFYGNLVANRSLGLDLLRYRNLAALQEKAQWFTEVLLITVLLETPDDDALKKIFGVLDADLATGVHYFLKKYIRKTDIVKGDEKKRLKKAFATADGILQASLSTTAE
ncbi:hypothetical protein BKA67DRAFT_257764 [Truncatella angustata]|uniref:MI domain-containing protein n=1 Tax=Truncatella angustata TaxID=152316 RepID=A0A9P8ZWH5_9PEZI|nr:uncharacterized protein BKA67DRAFT_257764 [Truncatella angustata]KAH6653717.1 hypothetical protein BKA67DRAFT_257764 [Truncatella angustata]